MRLHIHRAAYRFRASGFTLVELLVVMAILAVLMYLLSPVLAKVREKGRQTTCLSNQRQIAMAIIMEVNGPSEIFPMSAEVWGLVKLSPELLTCPSSVEGGNGYGYNGALSGLPMAAIASPTGTIVTGDVHPGLPGNIVNSPDDYDRRHDKRFIASFVDGHVKLIADPPTPDSVE